LLTSLLKAKAAAAAVAAVTAAGAAGLAYAGDLPSALQNIAHKTIDAPAAHSSPSTPVGPNASGSAAFGLCTAWQHASKHGSAAQKSVAFRNLATAAGGASNVAAFCASVQHPGSSASHPTSTSHPTGAPSSHASGQPTSHPSGQATSHAHPTGRPTANPTPTSRP
jgi:hypothetical protein